MFQELNKIHSFLTKPSPLCFKILVSLSPFLSEPRLYRRQLGSHYYKVGRRSTTELCAAGGAGQVFLSSKSSGGLIKVKKQSRKKGLHIARLLTVRGGLFY